MSDFAEQFLDRTGYDLSIADAVMQGKAPDWLQIHEIADLILYPERDKSLRSSVNRILEWACLKGELSARSYRPSQYDTPWWSVHRDTARRYFQCLGAFPEQNSPLWHWLTGWLNQKENKPTERERDESDFQQLCLEVWSVSPTIPIKGRNGIVVRLRNGYFEKYPESTLIKWAREIAPAEVSARRRPTKEQQEGNDSDNRGEIY